MIVSDKKKFVFFHNPKAGGSSVTDALAPWSNLGPQVSGEGHGWQVKYHYAQMHNTVAQSWDVAGRIEWMDYYWFAFVRNPFDLVASAWKKAQGVYANPSPIHQRRFEAANIKYGMPEISLLEYLNNELGEERLLHVRRTQTDTLLTKAPRKLDYIGRFETINEDWKKITKDIGINVLLPRRNQSNKGEGYRGFYDDETRGIVEGFYKDDLVNFNYRY